MSDDTPLMNNNCIYRYEVKRVKNDVYYTLYRDGEPVSMRKVQTYHLTTWETIATSPVCESGINALLKAAHREARRAIEGMQKYER